MKVGDTIFMRCRDTGSVHIYAKITKSDGKIITADVINGAWTMDILVATPPTEKTHYIDASNWAKEQFAALQDNLNETDENDENTEKEIPF